MINTKPFRPSIPNYCCSSTSREIIEELMEDVQKQITTLINQLETFGEDYHIQKMKIETLISVNKMLVDKFAEINERYNMFK